MPAMFSCRHTMNMVLGQFHPPLGVNLTFVPEIALWLPGTLGNL
jgi:hypothetical protein